MLFLFASDLHGSRRRYDRLWDAARARRPDAVLLGGDLLPGPSLSGAGPGSGDFLADELGGDLRRLRDDLGPGCPRVLLILGNDDPRCEEASARALEVDGLAEYVHGRRVEIGGLPVFGYSFVPPTPFRLKDWERYDVSRYTDPGCVSPEEGVRSVPVPGHEERFATIARDLDELTGEEDLSRAVFLFHAPPYRTALDRAALDGRSIDHAPLDVHVGSIAIRRFVEARQPRATLHGHVHESARLTGAFLERIGRTACLGAAHDGPELALVSFDPERPEQATRELL